MAMSLLNQEAYGPAGNDGSFQPNLDWYGPFLSAKDQWGPFLPNVRDTLIMSSYVDENRSKGLKSLSKEVLGYEQTSYEEVTTKTMTKVEWAKNPIGKVKNEWDQEVDGAFITGPKGEEIPVTRKMVKVQYKMNQLSASEVFEYGCDDTICTTHLALHFQEMMEIEDTVDVWDEVETYPVYLSAQSFVSGADFNHETMRAQEKDDDAAYDKAWPTLREYLIKIGFEGTVTPRMLSEADWKALLAERGVKDDATSTEKVTDFIPYKLAGIRRIFEIITGREFLWEGADVKVRTPSKWAKIIREKANDPDVEEHDGSTYSILAKAVEDADFATIDMLVARHYDGEPKLDLGKPKQIATLLYDQMGLSVVVVNELTDIERKFDQDLTRAIYAHRNFLLSKGPPLNEAQKAIIRRKAKADEDAIDYAVAFDETVTDEMKIVLKAFGVMKKVFTRRNLYYRNYWTIKHWKTGRIHASLNVCGTVTRRYSMSKPNLQQLPKKGEAVRFRSHFVPHRKNAIICSIDFAGQELRLAADISGDTNMLACYVGNVLKDIHSITASTAMRMKWGDGTVDMYMGQYGSHLSEIEDKAEREYALFLILRSGKMTPSAVRKKADDLRKDSKNVNFAAQFGGQALKLAMTLIMKVSDAQLFLEARALMFPGVDRMADIKQKECMVKGYAETLGGARRHLAKFITSSNRQEASRAARQAWNFWIQASAGEMTKLGMARFWLSGAIYRFDCRFIAPIHDELVTSVVSHEAKLFLRIKHWAMTAPYATMKVPILGSISLGPNFAKQLECGDDYDEDAIDDAIYSVNTSKELELDCQAVFSIVREAREIGMPVDSAIELYMTEASSGKTTQDVLRLMKEITRVTV